MEPEFIAAIIGGIFAVLAALIPLFWKRKPAAASDTKAPEGLAAVIGIVQKGEQILMVQRRTRYRGLSWQFPAGVVKPGEDMHDQVQSEVFAETGVRCKVTRSLGARIHDETKVLCHYFHCAYLDGEAANRDEKENSQVVWVKARDVPAYVTSSLYHEVAALLEEIAQGSAETGRVVLGVVLRGDKVLLVQRIEGVLQKPQWLLPGGGVEGEEADESAVVREVLEETGVACTPIEKLGERTHPQSGHMISYWLCRYEGGSAAVAEPEKFFSVLWVSKEDAVSVLGEDLFEPVREVLLGQ